MMRITTLAAAPLCGVALVYGCSSSSAGGADAGSDGSTSDVVHRDVHPPPADDFDSGNDGSTSTCPTPADISSWKPSAFIPPKTSPGACSASDFTGYDAACLEATTSSSAGCTSFQMANPACNACLNSNSTDATWGPLVNWSGVVDINLGGCLQLVAPSEAACALAAETADACPHVACDAVCPVTQSNASSFSEWQQCARQASADACVPFISQSSCLATDEAAADTVCDVSPSATFDALFLQIAPIFCGGGDGGSGEGGAGEGGTAEGGETDSAPPDASGE